MEHSQVVDLARAIADQSIQDTWRYWLLLLLTSFVVSVGGAFFGSWASKRAEVQAARDDQKEILAQLRDTTRTAEETKTAVAFGDWSERERRTVRRTKLEEMMILAFKTRDWLALEINRLIHEQEVPQTPSPQRTMRMLGVLYFPELQQPLAAFDSACDTFHRLLLGLSSDIQQARIAAGGGPRAALEGAIEVRKGAVQRIGEGYAPVSKGLYELEAAAAEAMAKMLEAVK